MPDARAGDDVTARCPKCGGQGWTAEHGCSSDQECWAYCPIQVQCDWCRGTGVESDDHVVRSTPLPIELMPF